MLLITVLGLHYGTKEEAGKAKHRRAIQYVTRKISFAPFCLKKFLVDHISYFWC
jgi:hypothetical protein